jgi:hypothetical protein
MVSQEWNVRKAAASIVDSFSTEDTGDSAASDIASYQVVV